MGTWYLEGFLITDQPTKLNEGYIYHAWDAVFVVVFFEEFQRSLSCLYHIYVIALKYVELVLLLSAACWAFVAFPEESLLLSRVEPSIHQFHNAYVIVVVEMLTRLANAFPINVVIVCFVFVDSLIGPIVLCPEPLEVIHWLSIFSMAPLPWYSRFSNGIPCSRSSFASRSADWFILASMYSCALGRLLSWWDFL